MYYKSYSDSPAANSTSDIITLLHSAGKEAEWIWICKGKTTEQWSRAVSLDPHKINKLG